MTKKLTLLIAALLVSLILGEVALRLLTPFPISTESNKVMDPILGYRSSPALADVDAHGFRNEDGDLAQATVAAIGDSHTYGFNVHRNEAWPKVLERLTGMPVYNYSAGGYGIYQYYHLAKTALENGQRTILIAPYPANDFPPFDCALYGSPYWQQTVSRLGLKTDQVCGTGDAPAAGSASDFLRDHLATVSAVDLLIVQPFKEKRRAVRAAAQEQDAIVAGNHRVSRKAAYEHARAADRSRPSVALAAANMMALLKDLQPQLAAQGARLGVLIIPSKERVMADWTHAAGVPVEELETVVVPENGLTAWLIQALTEQGFPVADALPEVAGAFARAVDAGETFYPSIDGHPFREGQAAYARAAQRLLNAMTGRGGSP